MLCWDCFCTGCGSSWFLTFWSIVWWNALRYWTCMFLFYLVACGIDFSFRFVLFFCSSGFRDKLLSLLWNVYWENYPTSRSSVPVCLFDSFSWFNYLSYFLCSSTTAFCSWKSCRIQGTSLWSFSTISSASISWDSDESSYHIGFTFDSIISSTLLKSIDTKARNSSFDSKACRSWLSLQKKAHRDSQLDNGRINV